MQFLYCIVLTKRKGNYSRLQPLFYFMLKAIFFCPIRLERGSVFENMYLS